MFNYENTNIIALNCARNCLRYVIQTFKIKKINIPFYTCPVVWQAVQKENCKISFYHIDENFMPTHEFKEQEFILYPNYFGICAKNVKTLSAKYKNLIVDNAQAFYMPKYGIASFNSARKFFPVADGAFLYSTKVTSEKFEQDASKINPKTFTYNDFCKNEERFSIAPIKQMSKFSQNILSKINIEFEKGKRLSNFKILNKALCKRNKLSLKLDRDDVPFVYPYFQDKTRIWKTLDDNNILVIPCWNPLEQKSIEGKFQKYLIPLPITNEQEVEKIINICAN